MFPGFLYAVAKYSCVYVDEKVFNTITEVQNPQGILAVVGKKNKQEENILIVTHGGVARAIYWYFNGINNSLMDCKNCKIYKYKLEHKKN